MQMYSANPDGANSDSLGNSGDFWEKIRIIFRHIYYLFQTLTAYSENSN